MNTASNTLTNTAEGPAEPRREKSRGNRRFVFKSPPRRPFTKRAVVQFVTMAVILFIGFQFAAWVGHLENGELAGTRPPGVEGFLPISALMSFRHWVESGEFPMVHPAGLVLFVLICLSALLLKKAFCSWLCPVGTVSEYLARLSHKFFDRRIKLPAWLDYPLMSVKYLLLAFFVHAIFFRMGPTDIAVFLDSPYNKVADIKMLYFFTQISPFALKVTLSLVVLSFLVPYSWCRYLCPYGALLGLLSIISPIKIRRSIPDCSDCGKCAAVCPSFVSVDKKTSVSSPECTGCLECVVNCPTENALELRTPSIWRRTVRPVVFAVLLAGLFYGGIGVAKIAGRWKSDVSEEELMTRVREGLHGPEYGHFGR